MSERCNLLEDHRRRMGSPPGRIVRLWLIAGSRWQRSKGEMNAKNVKLVPSAGATGVV